MLIMPAFAFGQTIKKLPKNADIKPNSPNDAAPIQVNQPDFGPYMRELQQTIKKQWDPPKGNESIRIVALFKVDKSGNITNIKIIQSGGVVCDEAAIKAIRLSSPTKPLPPEYIGKTVDIQFTFDYNVFNKSNNFVPVNTIKNTALTKSCPKNLACDSNVNKKLYKDYDKQVRKIVNSNLPTNEYLHRKTAEVFVLIKKDGQLIDSGLKVSSGSKSYDDTVIKSLKDCVFPKFPEGLNLDEVSFIYKITSENVSSYTYHPVFIPLFFPHYYW